MIERIPRWFLMVGIVTAAFGCDNVSWGGMSLSLEGPPRDSLESAAGEGGSETIEGPRRLEYGPLLYAGIREGDSALLVPIGELVDGGLHPLPAGETALQLADQVLEERLPAGRTLALYSQGERVGTLHVSTQAGTAIGFCSPRAQVFGRLELLPSASEAQRFLALEEPLEGNRSFPPFRAPTVDRAHRIAAQNLGGQALNELRAPWPAALQDIRQDLQVFQLPNDQGPAVVATFLLRDQLAMGPAPEEAYSLMIIGEPRGTGWERTYTWFRPVGEEGKGAPRYFSKMDWDGDGEEEILLEVLGADSRWWAALDREQGRWTLMFQDPCGTQAPDAPTAAGSPGGSR